MERQNRIVRDSQVVMTELVLPNDTNQLGNLLGGRLMHWIDIAAALSAMRHSNRVCVTASVDGMSFHAAIKQGQVVTLKASVNRVFNTSMEVADILNREQRVRIGLRSFVEEIRRKPLAEMSASVTDAATGVTYTSTIERVALTTTRGEVLADLYNLKVVASFQAGNETREESVDVYVHKPAQP